MKHSRGILASGWMISALWGLAAIATSINFDHLVAAILAAIATGLSLFIVILILCADTFGDDL